jgi:hypothetical protein
MSPATLQEGTPSTGQSNEFPHVCPAPATSHRGFGSKPNICIQLAADHFRESRLPRAMRPPSVPEPVFFMPLASRFRGSFHAWAPCAADGHSSSGIRDSWRPGGRHSREWFRPGSRAERRCEDRTSPTARRAGCGSYADGPTRPDRSSAGRSRSLRRTW